MLQKIQRIAIPEGGRARGFTTGKIETALQGGGSCLWVPESAVRTGRLYVHKNGVHRLESDYYGAGEVVVNVNGYADNGDRIVYPGPGGVLMEDNSFPVKIQIDTLPDKLEYEDGEKIDLTGIVVKAYKANGEVWTSKDYPDGVIPVEKLIYNPKQAQVFSDYSDVYSDRGPYVQYTAEQIPNNTTFTSFYGSFHLGSYNSVSGWGYSFRVMNYIAFLTPGLGGYSVTLQLNRFTRQDVIDYVKRYYNRDLSTLSAYDFNNAVSSYGFSYSWYTDQFAPYYRYPSGVAPIVHMTDFYIGGPEYPGSRIPKDFRLGIFLPFGFIPVSGRWEKARELEMKSLEFTYNGETHSAENIKGFDHEIAIAYAKKIIYSYFHSTPLNEVIITVSWPRPMDNYRLSATFDITVNSPEGGE